MKHLNSQLAINISLFLLTNKIKVILLVLESLTIQVITYTMALISSNTLDELINRNMNSCLLLLKCLFIGLVSNLLLQYILKLSKIGLQQSLTFYLEKVYLFNIYINFSDYNLEKNATLLSQNVIIDSENIADFIFDDVLELINNIFLLIISLFGIMKLNTIFFTISVISIPFYIVITLYTQSLAFKAIYESKISESKFNSVIVRIFQCINSIKKNTSIDSTFKYIRNLYLDKLSNYLKAYKIIFVFYSTGSIITSIMKIFFYYYGIQLVFHNKLSIGQFTLTLAFYEILLSSLAFFMSFSEQYNNFMVSFNRMLQKHKNISKENQLISSPIFLLTIKRFTWSFVNDNNFIFQNLVAKTGDIVKICGKNGVGKTTLINILSGIYPPPVNKIFINNVPLEKLNLTQLRKNYFSICDAKPTFLDGSVLFNISFFLDNLSLAKNDIKSFISKNQLNLFLNDINTLLDMDISELSTGQQKKISLLIAFMKKNNIIILDEPTIGLDDISKFHLLNFLKHYSVNKLLIVISHEKIFDSIITKKYLLGV